MFTVSKTHKIGVVFIESLKKIGLRRENKSPRPSFRVFYRSKSIDNEYSTFNSLKTAENLKISLNEGYVGLNFVAK